jgi:hypothetical protein
MTVVKLQLLRPSVHYVTEEPLPRNTTGPEISALQLRPRFDGECPNLPAAARLMPPGVLARLLR